MNGRVAALYRHPVKGFTPERRPSVELESGGFFPCDRIYAVEDGPSGFDPAAPAFIPKTQFAVLAKIPEVAKAHTTYDEGSSVLTIVCDGMAPLRARLSGEEGRGRFAAWLVELLGDAATGPLKVVHAPGHRFTDHPEGCVSILNLASVRDLGQRIGQAVDPLRFRANVYVDGWPAWAENEAIGRTLQLGTARLQVFKSIVRCAATEVNPATAQRDIEVPKALFDHYGHVLCGVYATVTGAGRVAEADVAAV
jgi:uncharacterized protein YcbX